MSNIKNKMRCFYLILLIGFTFLLLGGNSVVWAQTNDIRPLYDENSLLVKIADTQSIGLDGVEPSIWQSLGPTKVLFHTEPHNMKQTIDTLSVIEDEMVVSGTWLLVDIGQHLDIETVKQQLLLEPNVVSVEYNYYIYLDEMMMAEENGEKNEANQSDDIEPGTGEIKKDDIPRIDTMSVGDLGRQWYLGAAGLPKAQSYLEENFGSAVAGGSSDVIVAVIDSGVDYTHPDLVDNILRDNTGTIVGNDFGNNDVDPMPDPPNSYNKNPGHGTHVAGIIAATGKQQVYGVAYQAKIMPLKIFNSNGAAAYASLLEALQYASDHGAQIANMSLGISIGAHNSNQLDNPSGLQALREMILNLQNKLIVVAAAGNASARVYEEPTLSEGYPNEPLPDYANYITTYPAAYPEVVGVMSYKENADANGDQKSGFSRWDSYPNNEIEYEIIAPGSDIYNTFWNNSGANYATLQGTSMASPFVAGCYALLLSKYQQDNLYAKEFTLGDVKTILLKTTEPLQGVTVNESPPFFFQAVRIDQALAYREPLLTQMPLYTYKIFDGSRHSITASNEKNLPMAYEYRLNSTGTVGNIAPKDQGVYTVNADLDKTQSDKASLYYEAAASGELAIISKPGDWNGDGRIDRTDLEIFRRHLGSGNKLEAYFPEYYEATADLNNDGFIDFLDVLLLVEEIAKNY